MDDCALHTLLPHQLGSAQLKLQSTAIKRNQKCPCNSGKKLKHCCIGQIKEMQAAVDAGIDPRTILVNRILGPPSESSGETT